MRSERLLKAWLRTVAGVILIGCAAPAASLTPSPAPSPTPTMAATASPTATAEATSPPVATPVPSATAGPTATPVSKPMAPDILKLTYDEHYYTDGSGTITRTVRWTKDATPGTNVKVFGVNKCLTDVYEEDCVKDGMKIPSRYLLLLASAPASLGKASWDFWVPEGAFIYCGLVGAVADRGEIAPPDQQYYAIVLQAENEAGKSKFVVGATSANADVVC